MVAWGNAPGRPVPIISRAPEGRNKGSQCPLLRPSGAEDCGGRHRSWGVAPGYVIPPLRGSGAAMTLPFLSHDLSRA
jgi:hypothetical protein